MPSSFSDLFNFIHQYRTPYKLSVHHSYAQYAILNIIEQKHQLVKQKPRVAEWKLSKELEDQGKFWGVTKKPYRSSKILEDP